MALVNALNVTQYIPPPTLEPNHPQYITQESTYCSENIEHISSDGWSQMTNNLKDKRYDGLAATGVVWELFLVSLVLPQCPHSHLIHACQGKEARWKEV